MKKHTLLFLLTSIVLASSTSFGQFPPIRLDMVIHDSSGVPFTITWGLDENATDSIDGSLGEIQRPPLPPVPSFDVRWINPPGSSKLGKGVVLDLRDFVTHVQVDTYQVRFQPGPAGYPMTLAWSRVLVHDYYGCAVTLVGPPNSIKDQHGVLQTSVDMRANDSVKIVDDQVSTLLLIASCPFGSNSISGQVFLDMNGNGLQDAGEAGISGRQVVLGGDQSQTVSSDFAGNYLFTNLPNGSFTVHENFLIGWTQTYPAGDYSITLENGQQETYADFGDFQKGSLGGIKFDDSNGNGVRDEGEATLPNWKIYVNGAKTDSTTTDVNGHYSFSDLGPGTYTIQEKQDPDWVQMKPGAPGYYTIEMTSGLDDDTLSFGNKQANKFTGGNNANWSDPNNWSFGHPPGATDVVVLPSSVTFDVSNATVLAIRVADGGSLSIPPGTTVTVLGSFQVEEGSTLIFTTPPSAKSQGIAAAASQPGITCYGDWNVKGTFVPGNSRITFAGDNPKTILSTTFFDLEVDGSHTTTQGNVSVQNQITLLNTLTLGPDDSLLISNSSTTAVDNNGQILGGTIKRSIAPGETGPYRFTDPQTLVQFNGTGNPDFVSTTPSDKPFPVSTHVKWHVVPGTVNTSNHSVSGTGITHFSVWGIGTSGDSLSGTFINSGGGGSITINSGGGGSYSAVVQLGYNPDSLPPGTTEGSLKILTGPYYTESLPSSWNMLSLPVDAEDHTKSAVFPTSDSEAFAYNGSGYVTAATLKNGQGYWLRFNSPPTVSILGAAVLEDSIPLVEGWNLIGSVTYPVLRSSLITIPPNIIQGAIFGYQHGYQPTTTLQPLQAYWVKASAPGTVILTAPGGIFKSQTEPRSPLDDFNSITIVDAYGDVQTLYYAGRSGRDARQFEAPPLPPPEAFDVRFASNRFAEVPDMATEKTIPLRISGAVYPLTLRWNVKDNSTHASLEIDEKSIDLRTDGSISVTELRDRIQLKLSSAPVVALPSDFRLEQNYPNPFNPTTIIEYALPTAARVTVKIYDLLGREVQTLVDETQSEGFKQVAWSGESASGNRMTSGLYFYRLTATSLDDGRTTVQVKKMLLMK
ncbi:MAG: T9SS type A sorting domain-containing protein [Ignavibacteriae bacterium]|nr:T9SS type A sorting domain-containing protein [Ignavibacteria bacterium]MBI3365588.1 T9SS type A sorting domain-containing protein [Ignavibacteriota bacterium]